MSIYAVILAGGAGARFWPASRTGETKPFLVLPEKGSLLQMAWSRAARLAPRERIRIVCGADLRDKVLAELPGADSGNLVVEPGRRNTAAAITLAALRLEKETPGAVMVTLPADHHLEDEAAFTQAVVRAADLARGTPALVTLGVKPDRAETGYGYLEKGEVLSGGALAVRRFVEKPDRKTAEAMLASGSFLWNSGVFIWRPDRFLEALAAAAPEIARAVRDAEASREAGDEVGFQERYASAPALSVDHAVLEKGGDIATVPLDAGWSDLGNWDSLARLFTADEHGNRRLGQALLLDSQDCFAVGLDRPVAILGISGLVVVAAGGAVLVCPRDRAEEVHRLADAYRLMQSTKGTSRI